MKALRNFHHTSVLWDSEVLTAGRGQSHVEHQECDVTWDTKV